MLLTGLYVLAAIPALLAVRRRRLSRVLAGLPFGLLGANLAFALGLGVAGARSALVVAALLGTGCGVVVLSAPTAILLAGLVLCVATSSISIARGPAHGPATTGANVLLIVLDTTTAGHLSAYGYARPTSPNLEALARRGVLYRRAISAAPWTIPSHASIFTGRYPSELGFDGAQFDFDPAVGSIAADFRAAGGGTAAITANVAVRATPELAFGFDGMWDEWRLTRPAPERALYRMLGWGVNQSRGERITELALDWVDRLSPAGRPWLLFLNYLDPHAPYAPPPAERRRFAPDVRPGWVPPPNELFTAGLVPLTSEIRDAIPELYDGEVAAMDRAVGRLLRELGRRGYDENNLIVVVTADHGESLGEHGVLGHELGLPEQVLHVPLLIAGPGVRPAEIGEPVQTLQLRATLGALQARPLRADIAPALPPWGRAPDLIITEHPFPDWFHADLQRLDPAYDPTSWRGDWVALERDGVKVVFNDHGDGATYDLRADPGEEHPEPFSRGAELVRAYRGRHLVASRQHRDLTDAERSAMRQLGYLR
ncbi:MAG TPA: sulfatase [Candidatus Dormibacteraeota bacterium]|nr:sulfatase [Candidatus Dormibacteraeota bacterium]